MGEAGICLREFRAVLGENSVWRVREYVARSSQASMPGAAYCAPTKSDLRRAGTEAM